MTTTEIGCRYCGSDAFEIAVRAAEMGITDPICCDNMREREDA